MKSKSTIIIVIYGILIMFGLHSTAYSGNWFGSLFGNTVKGSGVLKTETRHVRPFTKIHTSGSQDIQITVGKEQSLRITFDDNLLDIMETTVKGKTLYIESRESYYSSKGCKIVITVPELSGVFSAGSGDIRIEEIEGDSFELSLRGSGDILFDGDVDELEINLAGSGDIYARGNTDILDISLAGSGDINARDLIAEDVEVYIKGSGDVSVYANKSFDGTVYGSGDINCYGNPEKTSDHVAGSGDITMK